MSIVILTQSNPGIFDIKDIFDPDVSGPNDPESNGKIVPPVNSIIIQNNAEFLLVESVDPATYKVTYAVPVLGEVVGGDDIASVVSYGNETLYLHYDNRTNPRKITVIGRFKVVGNNISKYRLILNHGLPTQQIISQYYNSNGNYTTNLVPMERVAPGVNEWWCPSCTSPVSLVDGQEVRLEVFDEHGGLRVAATLLTKQSVVVNEAPANRPYITGMAVLGTQMYSPNNFYLFEKQSISDLHLIVKVTFDDASELEVPIDNVKCFIYGTEDFISSFAGLRQYCLAKYFLSLEENADPDIVTAGSHIAQEFTITVRPNELADPIKISVLPTWSSSLSRYTLRYFYYSTSRNISRDITPYVTIPSGTFNGNNYTTQQSFTIAVNMANVDPITYTEAVTYQQNVVIKLSPIVNIERYVLRDSNTSPFVYGIDSGPNRRPVLFYDANIQQYFIPTSRFPNQASVINAFYRNANPPYIPDTEEGPITPTHFVLRDLNTQAMITAGQIPLTDYASAFNIIGVGGPGRYLGTNVVVEFIKQVDVSNSLILFGVPVDVYAGSYT